MRHADILQIRGGVNFRDFVLTPFTDDSSGFDNLIANKVFFTFKIKIDTIEVW